MLAEDKYIEMNHKREIQPIREVIKTLYELDSNGTKEMVTAYKGMEKVINDDWNKKDLEGLGITYFAFMGY